MLICTVFPSLSHQLQIPPSGCNPTLTAPANHPAQRTTPLPSYPVRHEEPYAGLADIYIVPSRNHHALCCAGVFEREEEHNTCHASEQDKYSQHTVGVDGFYGMLHTSLEVMYVSVCVLWLLGPSVVMTTSMVCGLAIVGGESQFWTCCFTGIPIATVEHRWFDGIHFTVQKFID